MVAKTTIDRLGKRTSSTSAGKHRRGRRALTGTRTYCGDRVAGEYEWGRLVGRGDRRACPRQDAGDDLERARDVGTLDPVVRHGAKSRAAPEVARDAQAALRARALERAGVHPLRVHLERDDVRDHLPRVDADPADAGEAVGQGARVAVGVGRAVGPLRRKLWCDFSRHTSEVRGNMPAGRIAASMSASEGQPSRFGTSRGWIEPRMKEAPISF